MSLGVACSRGPGPKVVSTRVTYASCVISDNLVMKNIWGGKHIKKDKLEIFDPPMP